MSEHALSAEPVVRAVEHVAWARWASPDSATVSKPLDAAREALVLALSDEAAMPWACLIAYRHLSTARRALPPVHENTKAERTMEVARSRLIAAMTALADAADANLHALAESESAPEAPWSLGAGRATPERSKARRSDSTRRKRDGRKP